MNGVQQLSLALPQFELAYDAPGRQVRGYADNEADATADSVDCHQFAGLKAMAASGRTRSDGELP